MSANSLSKNPASDRRISALSLLFFVVGSSFAVADAQNAVGDADPALADAARQVEFSMSRVRARRGEIARVVFAVRADVALKSIAVAIDFDESRLNVHDTRIFDENAFLLDVESHIGHNNHNDEPGNQLSEGWVFAKIDASDFTRDLAVSTGEFVPVLAIEFLVLRNAEIGFSPLRFQAIQTEGLDAPSIVRRNQIEAVGGVDAEVAVDVEEDNLLGGGIEIIGEVGFFQRGDVNFDEERNITDPTATLRFLFLDGPEMPCDDAADANDDGSLDVSDPVFMLTRLFLTREPYPEPEKWGPDPTPDELGCDPYDDGTAG